METPKTNNYLSRQELEDQGYDPDNHPALHPDERLVIDAVEDDSAQTPEAAETTPTSIEKKIGEATTQAVVELDKYRQARQEREAPEGNSLVVDANGVVVGRAGDPRAEEYARTREKVGRY